MRKVCVRYEPTAPDWVKDAETGAVVPLCVKIVIPEDYWSTAPRPPVDMHRLDEETGEEFIEQAMMVEVSFPVYGQ